MAWAEAFGGFDTGTIDFAEIFGDLFGFGDAFGGGGRRRSRAQRGGDLREDLTIEFVDAVFGCEREVSFRRREVCDDCRAKARRRARRRPSAGNAAGADRYASRMAS